MEITYKNKKLQKICTDFTKAERTYGQDMAFKIYQRINEIHASPNVDIMIRDHLGGCHRLNQDRKGQFAVHLKQPYRMLFTVNGDEVQIANIADIVDYH